MNLDSRKLPTTEQIRAFINELVGNKRLLMTSLAGIGAILALFFAVMVYSKVADQNSAEAWESYAELLESNISSKSPDDIREYARILEDLCDDLNGTLAEPWILKDLANTYFYLHEIPKARETYEVLQQRFPNHVVTIGLKTPLVLSDTVTQALDDCKRQEEFFGDHSKPPAPVKDSEGDGTSDPSPE